MAGVKDDIVWVLNPFYGRELRRPVKKLLCIIQKQTNFDCGSLKFKSIKLLTLDGRNGRTESACRCCTLVL